MPTRVRAAAADAREDIMSPAAISAMSPGVVSAIWFWHLFAVCEAKAARVAGQATHGAGACGDATFIEVYAKSLPALLTTALEARTSKH